jgi:hypothetical protein
MNLLPAAGACQAGRPAGGFPAGLPRISERTSEAMSEGVTEPRAADRAGLSPGPSFAAFYPWLLIATSAALNVAGGRMRPGWLAGGGLVIFAVLYMAAIWLKLKVRRQRAALSRQAA